MLNTKRFRRVGVVALSAWLAGCGGGPGPAATPARARGPIGGASGTELAEQQVLHLGNGAEPGTLDIDRTEDNSSAWILRDLYEGLVGNGPNAEVVPAMAESWTISEDGKTYTFHLRRDGRWSNGDPVTAHDFVYGMRRAVDPQTLSVYTFILAPIVNANAVVAGRAPPTDLGVHAVDDYTLTVELENATPYFLGLLTNPIAYPLHRTSFEQHRDQFTRPGNLVGNGPFMLDDWVVQSHIKVVRNPYYWDAANVRLEEIWFYPTNDLNAELQRYRADELDFTYEIPTAQFKWVEANLGDELKIAPYLGSYYYGFNVTRPPFKDRPKLRRALALAIDRDILTKKLLGAGERGGFGWVPPVANYTPQQMKEASWTQSEREAEAKRLYAEAGYSREHPLKTTIHYNTQDDHRRVAIAIAAMWRQVLGVETELLNQEWKVFLDTRNEKIETQVFRSTWLGDYNDAYTFAELFRSTSSQNDSGYASDEYDRLLDAAQATLDPKARAELLEAAERRLLTDMPMIPIYYYVSQHLVKPWIGGYESNIMDRHNHKNWYVLKH